MNHLIMTIIKTEKYHKIMLIDIYLNKNYLTVSTKHKSKKK